MHRHILALFIIALVTSLSPAAAVERFDIPTLEGEVLNVTAHRGGGKELFIWFTHHDQHSEGFDTVVQGLQSRGMDIWQIDLLDSLFLEENADTLRSLPAETVTSALQEGLKQGYEHITLMGTELLGGTLLRGIRHWQTTGPDDSALARVSGTLLFFPIFSAFTPAAGEDITYQPILDASNYPSMIFQPGNGKNGHYLLKVLSHLNARSSSAYAWIRPGLLDWYFLYRENDKRPTEAIKKEIALLPERIIKASRLLARLEKPAAPLALKTATEPRHSIRGLVKWPTPSPAPQVELRDLQGNLHRTAQWQGGVTLVNFWASWCSPCVEEIPSMNRLQNTLADENFNMLGINFRETPEDIRAFTAEIPVDFPILLDPDGAAADAWKVPTFPSSFLLDHRGNIRYSVNAGIDWNGEEALGIIRQLLEEANPPEAQTGQ